MLRIFSVVFVASLAGCTAGGPRVWQSPQLVGHAEALAGAQAAPALEARFGGVVRDASAERRMERVGQRLTEPMPELHGDYRYRLLDSDHVNAISLPGGRVYVTRGLYARLSQDDLLAAILAHEMAHLAAKDHFKPRCSSLDQALDKELSADARGALYLHASGYRPSALIHLVRLITEAQPCGWAQTRIAALAFQLEDSH